MLLERLVFIEIIETETNDGPKKGSRENTTLEAHGRI
jgi:hypothetical protein